MNTDTKIEKAATPEVTTAAESAEILKRCETHIATAVKHYERTEFLSNGLRAVIGIQMLIAKPHIPHGNSGEGDGFQAWLAARWPSIGYDSAKNWMNLGRSLLNVEAAIKGTVHYFKQLPEKFEQGAFDFDKDATAAAAHAKELMGDLGMMDFIAEHGEKKTAGGNQPITFHCPHCQARNKGLRGTKIPCVKCEKKIRVQLDVDPLRDQRARTERANELLYDLRDAAVRAREAYRELAVDGDMPVWQETLTALATFTAKTATLKQLRKTTHA